MADEPVEQAAPIFRTARFEVRSDQLYEAIEVVRTFVRAVRANEPGTRLYRAFQNKDNPFLFTHIMEFDDEGAEQFHRQTDWVKAFTQGLYPILNGGIAFEELYPIL